MSLRTSVAKDSVGRIFFFRCLSAILGVRPILPEFEISMPDEVIEGINIDEVTDDSYRDLYVAG